MSAAQAAEILGITSRGVEKQISALKKAGKLKRIGGDKGGAWKVKGK